MSIGYNTASIPATATQDALQIAYLDHHPPQDTSYRGTILLIHGFPQTSYQFHLVLPLLAQQGYRCIAPDYRGAGSSSAPDSESPDYRKSTFAADMIALLDVLGIIEKVLVLGHDIGGMVAFAMASRWPERLAKVIWGECPLPGTKSYYRDRSEPDRVVQQFHFAFHCVPGGLAEKLVDGNERTYISHFFDKIAHNRAAIDTDSYVQTYEQPGAMNRAFELYRAFETDAKENSEWIERHGKCRVPTLILSGEFSRHKDEAEEMAREVTDAEMVRVGVVEGAGHYLAEENPQGFGEVVGAFLGREE